MVQDLARLAELDDLALLHDRDPVRNLGHDPKIVRDEQNTGVVRFLKLLDQLQDLRLCRDVQGRGRLVGDEDLGLQNERHRDHGALSLAPRELVRIGVQKLLRLRQLNRDQHVQHGALALGLVLPAVNRHHLIDLVADGHDGVESGHGLLENHGDIVAANLA